MKNMVGNIPEPLMQPERKAEVIEWIRARGLPRRFERKLLQDWAQAVGATVGPEDYKAVVRAKGTWE